MLKNVHLSDEDLAVLRASLVVSAGDNPQTHIRDLKDRLTMAAAAPFPVIFPVTGRPIPEIVHEQAGRLVRALHNVEPRWGILAPSSLRVVKLNIGVSEHLHVEATGITIT